MKLSNYNFKSTFNNSNLENDLNIDCDMWWFVTNICISSPSWYICFTQSIWVPICCMTKLRECTVHGVQKIWLYQDSTKAPAPLQFVALSVTTWTAFSLPTISIASMRILEMNCESLTCPSQSIALKNIAPLGDIAITFINGQFLVSFHPLDIIVMQEVFQDVLIG